jgi:hypothetical protein
VRALRRVFLDAVVAALIACAAALSLTVSPEASQVAVA